jgi:hypothetical protein
MLVVLREGSCLRLCRKRRSGTEFVLWTSLKFRTIERKSKKQKLGLLFIIMLTVVLRDGDLLLHVPLASFARLGKTCGQYRRL